MSRLVCDDAFVHDAWAYLGLHVRQVRVGKRALELTPSAFGIAQVWIFCCAQTLRTLITIAVLLEPQTITTSLKA